MTKISKTSLTKKEDFYSYVNTEDNTDANYANAVRVYKDFRNKTFWRISWIICSKRYIKKKTLLLAGVFENLRNMSWYIWAWPCKISLISWIRIASSFKKDQNQIGSFNVYEYVINGRKRY